MDTIYKYPFTAIVGQQNMKRALLLNLIHPKIGGVLIKGEKGTAKSTMVRALTGLFEHKSIVELPLGATEDKVVGTLDIEHAIQHGEKRFEPGLLARAHGQILYVDEINLLEDHIVDILLDVAAMGVNVIEREGISHSHPAEFVLVGTMNPEEGELRPQLLDRFGLTVEVASEGDIQNRMEIVKRRLAFEKDPKAFIAQYEADQQQLAHTLTQAKTWLPNVMIEDKALEIIATIAIAMEVDGHRADLVMVKTARALAALEGVNEVTSTHIYEAAVLALPHRLRNRPFDEKMFNAETIRHLVQQKEMK